MITDANIHNTVIVRTRLNCAIITICYNTCLVSELCELLPS